MELDKASIEIEIKNKIIEIADSLGCDASSLQTEDIIPATGFIDSAGLLELVAWYEAHYDINIDTAEITIDNLGSLCAMADFLLKRKKLL